MVEYDLPAGVDTQTVETPRVDTHVLVAGDPDGIPVVCLHGNLSSSRFWAETMAALPSEYRLLAPDMRGYGQTEPKPIDATRGMGDFADDVDGLLTELGIEEPAFVGWSNGGGVALRYAIDHPSRVAAMALVNPLSPYGFGGTEDAEGTPTWPDYAGSGAGTANEETVAALAAEDFDAGGEASPRVILNQFYVDPETEIDPELEPEYLRSICSTVTGEEYYPGDVTESENWPGVAPGERGINNAISPKYLQLPAIVDIEPKPPVCWLRGAEDRIVSNTSFFDLGFLGQAGEVPGWPGADTFPPQPMVDQTQAVLDEYAEKGGDVRSVTFEGVGHAPLLEVPERFREELTAFLEQTVQAAG
jgi:pimeloyl-ACP methyl ester carboxylesterase